MGDIALKRVVSYFLFLSFILFLSSCSGKDYVDAIPENSVAVASVDVRQLFGGNPDEALSGVLDAGGVAGCGVDWSARLYVFETVEGNIGMAAKVSDDDKLAGWLAGLAEKGRCSKVTEQDGCRFAVVKGSWVVGFSSGAVVALGPLLPAVQAEARRKIAGYLGQDSDNSIKSSPLFDRLDSLSGPLTLVAQAAALPEKFAAPLMLGAPKDADASQVMVAAEISRDAKGCVVIRGETFSLNKEIDNALRQSRRAYRPITQKYLEKMPADAAFGVFMNVDGAQFIGQLHSNKTFQAILTGANMAIDMDNIIKSIDGDVAVMSRGLSPATAGLTMLATLKGKDFLGDVGYWKQSCPPGGKITDKGEDAYCYTDGDTAYYFGVTPDMQFYLRNTENAAESLSNGADKRIPADVVSSAKGARLALVLNVDALLGGGDAGGRFAKSLFGGTKTVLYIMK